MNEALHDEIKSLREKVSTLQAELQIERTFKEEYRDALALVRSAYEVRLHPVEKSFSSASDL